MEPVYFLTLRQLSGRWRLAIISVVAALPALVALLMLRSRSAPTVQDFEQVVVGGMLAGSAAPLVVLALAAAALGNELEDRTLANLILTPLPRWKIVLPKLLATVTIAAPLMAISGFVIGQVAYLGDLTASLALAGGAVAAVTLYAAAFLWLGLASAQAIGIGLVYIVMWEGFLSGFVSGVRLLSIKHHAIGLIHAIDPQRFADASGRLGPGTAAIAALLVLAGFTFLTVRRLRRMDVP